MFFWVGMRRCVPVCFAVGHALTPMTVDGGGGDRLHRARNDGQKACIRTWKVNCTLLADISPVSSSLAALHSPSSIPRLKRSGPHTPSTVVLRFFPPPNNPSLSAPQARRSLALRSALKWGSFFVALPVDISSFSGRIR